MEAVEGIAFIQQVILVEESRPQIDEDYRFPICESADTTIHLVAPLIEFGGSRWEDALSVDHCGRR